MFSVTNNTVIVTDGENGAYFYNGKAVHVPAVKAETVVDTIGAGDSHIGAVMACLNMGDDMEKAIRKANIISCAVVQNKGGILSDEKFNNAFKNNI